MTDSKNVTVLYHGGGCRDGFAAAWVMRMLYQDAEFLPVNYGEPVPDVDGRDVFLVDFCYGAFDLVRLVQRNKSVTVLDHHATAEATLKEVRDKIDDPDKFVFVFDTTKSGARLAWEWCVRESGPNEPFWERDASGVDTPRDPPWLVAYVEDRDLWRWALPNSRAVNAAIRLTPLEFGAWDEMSHCLPEDLIRQGLAVLQRDAEIVASHVRAAVPRRIAGSVVPAVNATVLTSEIGHELCQGRLFAAMYFDDLKAGVRRWSLRSDMGGMDVGAVAKSLGGGGHARAAGFEEALPA